VVTIETLLVGYVIDRMTRLSMSYVLEICEENRTDRHKNRSPTTHAGNSIDAHQWLEEMFQSQPQNCML